MTLSAGTRLGPYEIVSAIGAGGMGEVYRARDTKLDRHVAIKVLPDAFAADPERVARFQREAKTLASLNHPHIAGIYGLEDAGTVKGLVLELVEGPTLADRIAQGPIPIEEALAIARQIADALEAAHEQSIIHRDLKPANIKLRPDGAVKVLDFGLAKAFTTDTSNASNIALTNSPTITSPVALSGVGVLLGTAAYMAPEQARGRPVDKRADIWAFGCVLYEMLTGKPPFAGSDVSELLAGVIKSDPDWDLLPAELPPALRKVLHRCLHKDPKQRLRDIGDVRLALDGVFETPMVTPIAVATTPPVPKLWQRPLARFVGTAMLVAASGVVAWFARPSVPVQVRRLSINLPDSAPFGFAPGARFSASLAVSPDGKRLVYTASIGGRPHLYTRLLDELEARPLTGGEYGRFPFFSPDGEWIAFFHDGGAGPAANKLIKIPLRGGPLQPLCDAPFPAGGSWGDDGTIVFASGKTGDVRELLRVSSDGGTPEVLGARAPQQAARGWPDILPGGRSVLYSALGPDFSRLEIVSLDTGESRAVVEQGYNGRYVPTGHLIYMVDDTLMAVPFNLASLGTNGSPISLIKGVQARRPNAASLAVSEEGTLVYQPGVAIDVGSNQRGSAVIVTRDGRATPVPGSRGLEFWPRLSPDDSQVAFSFGEARAGFQAGVNTDIWTYDLNRGTRDPITTEPSEESFPDWTPDGSRIVFLSTRTGSDALVVSGDLYWQALDRGGPAELLLKNGNRKVATSWSPDGKVLAYYEINDQTQRDIWMLPIGGKPEPFLITRFNEEAPSFSPDGRWIAYVSEDSGERQVYVTAYPGPGRRIPISTDGGEAPVWSRDGRELFYFRPQSPVSGQLMAVDVMLSPTFKPGDPRVLFDGPFVAQTNGNPNYDVFRDGKRFVMIQQPNLPTESTPLVVVLNWFEELKRLAPPN